MAGSKTENWIDKNLLGIQYDCRLGSGVWRRGHWLLANVGGGSTNYGWPFRSEEKPEGLRGASFPHTRSWRLTTALYAVSCVYNRRSFEAPLGDASRVPPERGPVRGALYRAARTNHAHLNTGAPRDGSNATPRAHRDCV